MNNDQSVAPERPVLTFCVEGLPAREELFFKAMMRLVDHLTNQQWCYHPATAYVRVDMLVVAEGIEPTYYLNDEQQKQQVLQVGATGASGPGLLSSPLRFNDLEKELNRLGELILKHHEATKNAVVHISKSNTSTNTSVAPVAPARTVTAKMPMRLRRWPPATLLVAPGRMRLATLLTGRALTVDELSQRAALPLEFCKAFVDDLEHAALLMAPSAESAPTLVLKPEPKRSAPLAKALQPGLLDRIRMRLGIKSASH